jgi:hypothetical protein
LDRNVPNFCTWTRAPVRAAGVDVVAMLMSSSFAWGDPHHMMT